MPYSLLADLVLLIHLLFILFAAGGGLLVFRWRSLAFFHLPAALWAVLIEWRGWICPLTPLENWFRKSAGEVAYEAGFIEHYLAPVLYPDGMTRGIQVMLGTLVLLFNAVVYALVIRHHRKGEGGRSRPGGQGGSP